MKRWFLCLVLIVALAGTSIIPTSIQAEESVEQNEPKVELTDKQKKEMAKLHKDVLDKKKEVINKYVEYGVFTEEKGEKITEMFDKHYSKLEKNGFIPKWDAKRKQHHKE